MTWPADYPGYVPLTVPAAQVAGGPHAGFVGLITEAAFVGLSPEDNPLDTAAGRFSADGSDLVVSDASDNRMALDIVSWAPAPGGGTCELWVRERAGATFQPTSAGNVTLRVWFDSAASESQPAVGAAFGRNEVWPDAAVAVLMESSTPVDRTGNHTLNYADPVNPTIAGPYGTALNIGSGQRIYSTAAALLDLPPLYDFTVDLIGRVAGDKLAHETALGWEGADDVSFYLAERDGEEDRVYWRFFGGSILNGSTPISFGQWTWGGFTSRASNDHEMFRDGVSTATSTFSASTGPFSEFTIGGRGTAEPFEDDLAQAIVWSPAISMDRLSTQHANQNDPGAFWTPGAFVETGDSVTGTATASTGPASVAASGAHGVSGTSAASSGAAQVQASGAVSDPESTAGIGAAVTARARGQGWGLVTTPPDYRDIGDAFILEVGVPYSVNSIINGALDLIASNGIASLSDSSSHVGNAIKRNFDVERDSLLREYPWNFAMRRAKLAASSEAPAFRFRRAYELPAGPKPEFCLRVWAVGDDDSRNDTGVWEISGRRLLTDLEAPLPVRYIGRIVNPALWDPLTVKALEARLAWQAAYMASGSAALAEQMARIYQERLDAAKAIDAQEGTPEPFEDGTTWVDLRLTGASW